MLRETCCGVITGALLLLSTSTASAESSYCPGCTAAIAATGAALVGGIGAGIYFVHRSHTSLKGCVQQSGNGYSLIEKNGNTYELTNAPDGFKAHERVLLRGHKSNSHSGHSFRVDRISRDYGACE